jgi:ribosomal protein S1
MALRESGEAIRVEAKGVSNSGVTVDVDGLGGFVPKSQLGSEIQKDLQNLVGKRFEAVVIEVVRGDNKVILSEKEVSEAEELAKVRTAIEKVKEGRVFDGEVTNVFDFGCFVKIGITEDTEKNKKVHKSQGVEVEGLVHVSEISWDKIRKPEDIVKVGDKVKVKVIGKTKGKLSLSIKQAQKDPWEEIEKKYKKDSKLKGKVAKTTEFGVFISLEPGVEGLLHMTKIPHGKTYSRGDEVNVTIEEVDKENHKISLGLVLTEKPVGYK